MPAAKKPAAKAATKTRSEEACSQTGSQEACREKACRQKARSEETRRKKPAAKRKPNAPFMKAMTPSATLAAIIGAAADAAPKSPKKIWDYIKKNKLQDAVNKRMINADAKLKELFQKAQVSMFEMTKLVSNHLK